MQTVKLLKTFCINNSNHDENDKTHLWICGGKQKENRLDVNRIRQSSSVSRFLLLIYLRSFVIASRSCDRGKFPFHVDGIWSLGHESKELIFMTPSSGGEWNLWRELCQQSFEIQHRCGFKFIEDSLKKFKTRWIAQFNIMSQHVSRHMFP